MTYKVITISREFGSAGRTIGRQLADELGIKCYDREIISEAAKTHGMEVVGVVHNGFPPADPRLDADAVAATRRQLDRLGFPPVIVRLPPVPECGPWPDVDFGELFA